jgi:hypothetical protein
VSFSSTALYHKTVGEAHFSGNLPTSCGLLQEAREYVKKRKISGGTRSDAGRRSRDTFTSLKKTCRKLGISFWLFLKDRLEKTQLIPTLAQLIRNKSIQPA